MWSIDTWRGRGLFFYAGMSREHRAAEDGEATHKKRGQEPISLRDYGRSATGRANSLAGASLQWQAKGEPALSR